MGHIRVIMNTGSDRLEIDLGRVPVVGEEVRINSHGYIVRRVVHTPNAPYTAEIFVSLSPGPQSF
jgi:hypothetical protein